MMQMRIKAKANKPTGGRFSREIMAQRHQIYLACKAAEARKLLRETRSMKRKKTQKIAKSQVFSLENLKRAIEKEEPAIFDVCAIPLDMIVEMKRKLRGYMKLHRTTTNSLTTVQKVLDDVNGLLRIEEGVHANWQAGSADEIMSMLFEIDSALARAWHVLKGVQIFVEQKTSPIMMLSGDSTKILVRSQNHGGVDTGRELQITPCHFDNVQNLTMCLWGVKTFLLAKPVDVAYGPSPDINLNREVDTSGEEFTKYVVRAGQVLYLPPKWWHEVC
jgi:hypothetical protein